MVWGSVAQGVGHGHWEFAQQWACSRERLAAEGLRLCTRGPRCLRSQAEWLWFLASAQSRASCLLLTLRAFSGCATDWGAVYLVGFPSNIAQLRNCNWWCARSWIKIITPHDTFTPDDPSFALSLGRFTTLGRFTCLALNLQGRARDHLLHTRAHAHSFTLQDNPDVHPVGGVMACGFFWACRPETCLIDGD